MPYFQSAVLKCQLDCLRAEACGSGACSDYWRGTHACMHQETFSAHHNWADSTLSLKTECLDILTFFLYFSMTHSTCSYNKDFSEMARLCVDQLVEPEAGDADAALQRDRDGLPGLRHDFRDRRRHRRWHHWAASPGGPARPIANIPKIDVWFGADRPMVRRRLPAGPTCTK